MKKTLTLLIAVFSLSVQAQVFEITCDYQYETYTSVEELTDSFTIHGIKDGSGLINFNTNINDLPAYFFPEDRYGALWHSNSSIYFNAQLQGKTLRYSFMFNNYILNNMKIMTVYKETRVLDMTKHFEEDELDFEYDDGKVVSAEINNGPWVNNNHVQIDSCEISYFK